MGFFWLSYLKIFIYLFLLLVSIYFLVACLLMSFRVTLGLSAFKNKGNLQKSSSYECGFSPFFFDQNALIRNYQVNFIVLAILYILFDIEIIFLLGWGLYFPFLALWSFLFLYIFILLILLGFFFEYRAKLLNI